MKKLLILDSNSIINRAYYGVRALSASDGMPTNAVYGFMNMLIKLINEQKPDYLCAAFDLKAPTFRHKMYDGYKAQRHPMPDELARQMPYAKEILRAMNVTLLELEGYEADDIIGTVSRICGRNDVDCYIATGDKDDLQLADKNTRIILTVTKMGRNETTVYDEAAVKERYHVTPREFIDVKALMGDPSDNIPGVKGIGEKTAASLIEQHHSIEYIYDNLDSTGIKGKMLEKLINGRDMAFLSKTLSEINVNVPIEFSIEDCVFGGFSDESGELYSILKRLELNSVIKKLNLTPPENSAVQVREDIFENMTVSVIDTPEKLARTLDTVTGEVSFIPYFSGDCLSGMAFASGNNAYCTAPSLFGDALVKAAKPFLENENVKKNVCGIKDAIVKLAGTADIKGVAFDVSIAAYLLNPSRNDFSLEGLCEGFMGVELPQGEEKQLSLIDDDMSDETAAKHAAALGVLKELLADKIKENNQEYLYYEIELPLISVLAHMQINGFTVDKTELEKFSAVLSAKLDALTKEIYMLSGEEFNINSPKQLGTVLFEKLELKPAKKTKTGYSTNADALEKIKDKHPIVTFILKYRQYAKLKSTYCDGLSAVINPVTKRIHSNFNQTVTVTGRISSTEPNMQNIPTRTELGREIRRMFIAEDGYTLVDADYSQIELRVLAHMAKDETMINAFKNNEDIHAVTASQVLGIPADQVTKEQRSSAKAVNFGIVYGIGEFSLSQDIGVSVKEAKQYIESYLAKYHGVREYMENVKKEAKEKGYVTTMMNRIRYIPELKSQNYNVRQFGERAAMNTPIQGSAADIIKLAMVKVDSRLVREKLKSRLLLQVHDELIVEAHNDEIDAVRRILKEEMENAVKLDVPLVVDMAQGHSWYEAK